jgi:hypothetical protein
VSMAEERAEWHLSRGREQAGPYPFAKVLEAVERNVLRQTDYVWRQGWSEWRPAGAVPELFSPPPAVQMPRPAPAEEDYGNYIVRHWHGEFPLLRSFWVNGVALTLTFQIVVGLAAALFLVLTGARSGDRLVSQVTLLTSLLTVALMTWQCFGIWRSASQHEERGGHGSWAAAAKLVVILWVFIGGSTTVLTAFAPILY